MGQYYQALVVDKTGGVSVYDGQVSLDGGGYWWAGSKLMEHAWWCNTFVDAVAENIYKDPKRIIWFGDYADDFMDKYPDGFNGLSAEWVSEWSHLVWGEASRDSDKAIKGVPFLLDGKFLINHSKRLYVDCDKYYDCCDEDDSIHPLPLLTCIGNGMGGGDYSGTGDSTDELVGSWAYDMISVEDEKPVAYTEIFPVFKEAF